MSNTAGAGHCNVCFWHLPTSTTLNLAGLPPECACLGIVLGDPYRATNLGQS